LRVYGSPATPAQKIREIGWRSISATYTIAKTSESRARTVRVVHAGKVETYTLGVQNPQASDAAPLFVLTPSAGAASTRPLFSLVSECDA
jgi:hypothetical protein